MKKIFARHGIPQFVISDNGPQYSSFSFAQFAKSYGFQHCTSSPGYPQANGEAERVVQLVKQLWRKEEDPYLALMSYLSTPIKVGYSPDQLLMSRNIRSLLPVSTEELSPKLPDTYIVRGKDRKVKKKQRYYYDQSYDVREEPVLHPGEQIWISDQQQSGQIVQEEATRSYRVRTEDGREFSYHSFINTMLLTYPQCC